MGGIKAVHFIQILRSGIIFAEKRIIHVYDRPAAGIDEGRLENGGCNRMIRFYDTDVGCVEYNLLNRSKLLSYFLSGHVDEIVCVYDGSDEENYVGIITYYSLLYALSLEAAILKEYVLLDQDIWRNAREIFRKRGRGLREVMPLPVLDKDYQLICFAYQDEDANREIRMLRELREAQGVLQFPDVFPEYKCVKIHEFNELAFFFAEYLRDQNIPVQVGGAMWQEFFANEECKMPEYECLNIYAEGTWERKRSLKENLLRSVSVEFECIDKIYEANIKSNLIKDVSDGYNALIERLRTEKEIMLCGIDMKAQDAYDFLIGNGIEICCFVVDQLHVECMHRLFGKEIISLSEAVCVYKNAVFIDCASKHSAWGLGSVDYFDYIGYRRNERYIMLRDYIEVPGNNLLNAFSNTEVVLTGDKYLCGRLYEYLMRKQITVIGYLHTLQEDIQLENIPEVLAENVNKNVLCLIVVPAYFSYTKNGIVGEEEKQQCIVCLREKNIDNYTDYFCDISPFINVEKDNDIKYKRQSYKPKRIVLGSILGYSGNVFFRTLVDSHPFILSMDYCDLNNQLFWICVRLSMECAENILPLFWKLIGEDVERSIDDRTAFVEKMKRLLTCNSKFTSQELFVMLHVAYMYMFGRDVSEDDMRSMIIYWEPHHLDREKMEECVKWLGAEEVTCDIINVVRNSLPQKGSRLKTSTCIKEGVKGACFTALRCTVPLDQKEYEKSGRLVVRFEDLKCNPREMLENICGRWDIAWSDTLLQTTRKGQECVYRDIMSAVSGFDLRPVYNTYENFFSEFDRLRMMLTDVLWQKKYGYPYVEPNQFTRRELQEMFLKELRLENQGDTTGLYKGHLDLDDRIVLQASLRYGMQEIRCLLCAKESVF